MAIRCVAGLGNPGQRYRWTRHNAGFWVVEHLADQHAFVWRPTRGALEAVGSLGGGRVVLLKPMTFMNRSGDAVAACLERYALRPEELLVVVDDAAIPESKLRLRRAGSAGGHRGLESIGESLGMQSFPRLRVGVGAEKIEEDLAEYVLRMIPEEDRARFAAIAEDGARAVRDVVREGLDWAMNRHNPSIARPNGPVVAPVETKD